MLEDVKEFHRENLCGTDPEKVNKIRFGKCAGCKNRYTYHMDLLQDFYYFCPLLYMHRFFNAPIYIEKYKLGDDSIIFSIESDIQPEKFHKFIDDFEYMEVDGIGIAFKDCETTITQILPFNNVHTFSVPTWILDRQQVARLFYNIDYQEFPLYEYIVDNNNIILYDINLLKYLAPNILKELKSLSRRYHSSASSIQKWWFSR